MTVRSRRLLPVIVLLVYLAYLAIYLAIRKEVSQAGALSMIPMLLFSAFGIRAAIAAGLLNVFAHIALLMLFFDAEFPAVFHRAALPLAAIAAASGLAGFLFTLVRRNRRLIVRERTLRMDLERSLQEKEMLFHELNHRVKNNYQLITNLLDLYEMQERVEDPKEVLRFIRTRIRTMAVAHTRLSRIGAVRSIDLGAYLKELAPYVLQTITRAEQGISLTMELGEAEVPTDTAVFCGIVLNEALTNAVKHAFPEDFDGRKQIRIILEPSEADGICFAVSDSGTGFPYAPNSREKSISGTGLIEMIVRENLKGTVRFRRAGGTSVEVRFPHPVPPRSRTMPAST